MKISLIIKAKQLTSLFAINILQLNFFYVYLLLAQVVGSTIASQQQNQNHNQQNLYASALSAFDNQNQIADQLLAAGTQLGGFVDSSSSSSNNNNVDYNHNIPGHYEFEVAPKMEPPTVKKPPYVQSAQLCPGSG